MAEINQSRLYSKITCTNCNYEKVVPISTFQNNTELKCPKPECKNKFHYKKNCFFDSREYPNMSPDGFTHPLDQNAISALKRIPGIDYALRKMMEYGYEKTLRVRSMADDVKVTSKTCSYIHEMAVQSAKSLDIPLPDVFINQNPFPNAKTFGTGYPIITIQSGLVELLSEDELYAVVAHEMAHIKCEHVLYLMLADFLVDASSILGLAGGFIISLRLALFEWSRKAELSADRGALIVTNNKDASIKVLMKLSGGSAQLSDMIDESEFVSQAQQFDIITKGFGLNKFYRIASTLWRSHPFPVLRAHEINKWSESDEYKSIYSGNYTKMKTNDSTTTEQMINCPHCGQKCEEKTTTCSSCGQNIKKQVNQHGSGFKNAFDGIKSGMESAINLWTENFGKNSNSNGKICPKCNTRVFGSEMKVCPIDGAKLIKDRRKNSVNNDIF